MSDAEPTNDYRHWVGNPNIRVPCDMLGPGNSCSMCIEEFALALAQIKRMQDFIVERGLSADYDKWILTHAGR